MDSNANAGPSRPQSQQSLHAPSERNHASTLAPSFSNIALGPATPAESDAPGTEYFGPLASAASRRSRFSAASYGRSGSSIGASDGNAVDRTRRPSIRIRRGSAGLPSTPSKRDAASQQQTGGRDEPFRSNRPRSVSQPGPAPPLTGDGPGGAGVGIGGARHSRHVPQIALPRLTEEGARPTMAELGLEGTSPITASATTPPGPTLEKSHSAGEAGVDEDDGKKQKRSIVGRLFRPRSKAFVAAPLNGFDPDDDDEYHEELVDWLDIVDPEVQTLSTLTNVQNSLFIPDLGSWVNRRPTYVLSPSEARIVRPVAPKEPTPQPEAAPPLKEEDEELARPEGEETDQMPYVGRSDSITSRLTDSHFAALPHGRKLEGWSAAQKWELDDHVRHMLHSRRSKFKRQMKGFGQYVRRPLGFCVTLYATLITLFGLAWVLFLIGWIYVGDKQDYTLHIIDSVLVALFAIVGDGMAPFRAVDTYHMIFVARYSRIIHKAKKKAFEEKLAQVEASKHEAQNTDTSQEKQPEALPSGQQPALTAQALSLHQQTADTDTKTGIPPITIDGDSPPDMDLELARTDSLASLEADYLTPKQRKSLDHHQSKLAKSHSFYKPHETFTHHSFPLGHLIAIILLLDFHSCLQISLGACTWGISYHHRNPAITTVILCVSITTNLTAGLVIMFGDRKARKKDVVKLLERQALTDDAIKALERKREKQAHELEHEDDEDHHHHHHHRPHFHFRHHHHDKDDDDHDDEKRKDKEKDKEIEVSDGPSAATSHGAIQ